MANADNTTATDYFTFVCDTMNDLHDAMAVLAGARSLFCESVDVEVDKSLVQVRTLLYQLDERLEAITRRLDESSFDYELNGRALQTCNGALETNETSA